MAQQEQNNMRLYGITTQDIDGQEFIKVVSSNYKALSKSGENIWYTDAKIIDVYNLELPGYESPDAWNLYSGTISIDNVYNVDGNYVYSFDMDKDPDKYEVGKLIVHYSNGIRGKDEFIKY